MIMLILSTINVSQKFISKIADNYYYLIIRGHSENFYIANTIGGKVEGNNCYIPIMNLNFQAEGKILECIYKPTRNLNEFEITIKFIKN